MTLPDPNWYCFQSWYVKLWRCRHYLLVPYVAVRCWLRELRNPYGMHWRASWGLAICLAQYPMEHVVAYSAYDKEQDKVRHFSWNEKQKRFVELDAMLGKPLDNSNKKGVS